MKDNLVVAVLCALAIGAAGITGPALAQNVLTTHRLSAGLPAEAVAEAVTACASRAIESLPRSSIRTGWTRLHCAAMAPA
jgi:hypothetical protein